MRFIPLLLLVLAFAPEVAVAQQAPVSRAPFVVEQTYWIRPGKELQFIAMFEKNRVPLLRARMKDGDILWMRLSKPQFNATHDQWDLRVTVAWRDADTAVERIALASAQVARDTQRMAVEHQILDELILDRTDVPVLEWTVGDAGN